jgi:putative restriction endonuclease
VTDGDWARFLADMAATEVNFWLPGPDTGFRALRPDEPFLFKTHYPHNRIVGGGFFEHFAVLRASEALGVHGHRQRLPRPRRDVDRVRKYRPGTTERDPSIGCVILNEVVFFDPALAPPGPASMAKNIVRGKCYQLPGADSEVERAFAMLLAGPASPTADPDVVVLTLI